MIDSIGPRFILVCISYLINLGQDTSKRKRREEGKRKKGKGKQKEPEVEEEEAGGSAKTKW